MPVRNPIEVTWSNGTSTRVGDIAFHATSTPATPTPSKPKIHTGTDFPFDKKADFPYPLGVEFTFTPPHSKKSELGVVSSLASHYSSILEIVLKEAGVPFLNVHRDGYSVEVNSPVFTMKEELKDYWVRLKKQADLYGLLPTGHKVASGGNHLHMGPLPKALAESFFFDIFFRRYVGWVFNDPDDTITALSLCKDDLKYILNGQDAHMGGKSKVINYRRSSIKTIEWRGFRSPWDWEELEAQVDFIYAYLKWMLKKGRQKKVREYAKKEYMKARDPHECKYEEEKAKFFDFLAELGLSSNGVYAELMKQNMFIRFKFGKLN